MLAVNALVTLVAFAVLSLVRADVTPSEPAPGESFNTGSTCLTTWESDANSTTLWKNMAIELMTGSNLDMVHLTTVATGQDGTVSGRFTFPCPAVTPNSAIYFYQYSSPQTSVKTWTGRFTIASASGQSTPPANPTQPDSGDPIPWGKGALVDPSKAVAAPSFAASVLVSSTSSSSISSNSSTTTVASGGPGAITDGATPALTSSTDTGSSSVASSTASPSAQSNNQSGGALGAMTGFDTRVLGVVAAATLALSFIR